MNFAPTLRADAVMATVPEYRLDMLGPWESAHGAGTEALTTSWVSPDPLHDGGNIFYSEITALYTNGLGNPIYFEGTDPRDPGVPNSPPVVGTPREQFEEGLTVGEWHAYMDLIGQHKPHRVNPAASGPLHRI